MRTKITTPAEAATRMTELVNDSTFRTAAVRVAKEIGITAAEWNANKMMILMTMASQIVANEF